MEKAITTALFVIASVAAALGLINGVIMAVGKSSSALLTANSTVAQKLKTDHEIVFVTGDTSSAVITMWVKNTGTETIHKIEEADLFLERSSGATRIQWASTSSCPTLVGGGTECWEYTIEDGETEWVPSGTIKVVIRLVSLSSGVYKVRFTLANGVSAEKEFSV